MHSVANRPFDRHSRLKHLPRRRFGLQALLSSVALASFAACGAGESRGAEGDRPAPLKAQAPQAPAAVASALQDRDYPKAIKEIEKAIGEPDAPRDYLHYLKGRALHLNKQYDDSVAAFEQLERDFAESVWARRARFGRAVALARKGDFQSAELIYRDEAAQLLSADRKQEIADIYLEFARGYFKPADENQPPDFNKALEFFGKALEVGPKPAERAEVQLQVARCYQALGNLAEAAQRYSQFSTDHPTSELDVEARYLLGECQLGQGQAEEARRTWQDLLAARPDAKSARVAEAAFNISRTHNMPEPDTDENLALGVVALEEFVDRFPDHKLASQAYLRIAAGYMHRGRNEDAQRTLERFLALERYADTEEAPDARNLLGRSLQLQKKFDEALAAWKDYLARYPAHRAWSDVQREIVNTAYLLGAEALAEKRYEQARKLWTEFLAHYPLDERHPRILYQFGRMQHEEQKWDAALADWRRLVTKYPNTEESSLAQFMIAVTLEEKLGKLADALKEYRKLNWGRYAAPALQRIVLLTNRQLAIATERVFRSDETPKIKLTTRNIETVTVRAYTVDLETYFRKMHLAGGVEGLDIALIDPDKTFEFEIPKYAQYQQLASEIEVPLPAAAAGGDRPAGVLAVTVSSKTLEATTLVLQSDLEVIVKSSRDEVFVFAENLRTGEPWPEARLLISNGQQVFAEAQTGADGVFQQSYEELKSAADVRVFAVADSHVASNLVGLEGVGVAVGLSDRGYIYTDRPAYRAGQTVHVRGVLRRADRDAYLIDAGKAYHLEVFDGRNRLIHHDEVKLGAYGGFHAQFSLPVASVQGAYRVQVRDDDDRTFQGEFNVHEYQLEPVRISVETERKVFYRGEEIEGKIVARFYYGAPLVGKEIRYQLAGGRVVTGKTDEQGELAFKLATREFRESQALPLVVTLAERNLQTSANFYLATQGYRISLSTVRPVYVAGETFDVTLSTTDAEGKPIAEKLALRVLEKTEVDGKVGERQVDEREVSTDDKGQGRLTLRLEKGAEYTLRAEGTDRFKNPISATYGVKISDDQDRVRLRILADKHSFNVGDTARVQLHWREAPALALVTFQGARVLDYRLVALAIGANELEIPLTARLAPNFELAVAVMTNAQPPADEAAAANFSRFHEASSPFTVERDLNVTVETRRKAGEGPVRPGDEVEITVTTTDPQGQPVAAELSLALIEQSLWEMFGANAEAIQKFFRGQPREPAVRTLSSATFSYRPSTLTISPELLAEKDRLELEAEEAERIRAWGDAGAVAAGATAAATVDYAEAPGSDAPPSEGAIGLDLRGAPFSWSSAHAGLEFGTNPQGQTETRFGRPSRSGGEDLESLSALITDTISPTTWDEVSGEAVRGRYLGINDFDVNNDGDGAPSNHWYFNGNGNLLAETFASHDRRDVTVLFSDGSQANVNFGDLDSKHSVALVRRLAEAGAVLLPAGATQETAYWNPSVVTDEAGKATVTLTVPERTTAWKLLAKGVTADTLAGEADSTLVVKSELFGELKLPLAFTDGDEAEILATVHNDAVEEGEIEVTLTTTVGGKGQTEKKTLKAKKGIQDVGFRVTLKRPEGVPATASETASFELQVAAGERRASTRRSVPLTPDGMQVYATASGAASSDITAFVEPPPAMELAGPTLEILVGPSVERSLLDVLLAPAPACQLDTLRLASGLDAAASDLMAALGLQQLVGASREAEGPQAEALDQRIRASLGLLVSSQTDDGGWSWTGQAGAGNRYATARVVWALSLARAAGYNVSDEAFEKALAWLNGQIVATPENDYESKAILLQAMAAAGRGDFTLANRLHRNRPALSNAALAYLALALAQMDRQPMAGDILDVLAKRNLDESATRRTAELGSLPWSEAPVELRALILLALEQTAPQAERAKQTADWLLAHRVGHRWNPDKATGPATLALCRWFAKNGFEGEHYQLTVSVNGFEAQVLDVTADSGTQTVAVPAKLLKAGKQRIQFQLTGRGRFTYQCVLGGFVPSDKLKSTTKQWQVRRHYEPAPRELDGEAIGRGFGVLQGSYTPFRNPLTQLPVGQRGHVELQVYRQNIAANTPEEQLEYLVLTEPLPSGATVIQQSVQGGFERFEIGPGAITFYVGTRQYIDPIHFDIHGYLPGEYRAAPTVLRNPYRPEQLVVAEAKQLSVLPLGAASGDEYRLSPQELYELGKRQFGRGQLQAAGAYLTELVAKWQLVPEVYQDSVRMLLDVHLKQGPDAEIVRYFEIIKEKWPDLEIPFEKIVRIGAAYHEIGEYERSYLVFRATVESSFLRESSVAGFLEAQGEFLRSVDVMGRLLSEYPPEPYVAAVQYALAQRVYAYAPQAAGDAKLREKKINRVDLVRQALEMLGSFLTAYPDDPAADQAAFSVGNALLELKLYRQAIESSNRAAERYPESDFVDSYWYIVGYCHFALGEHAAALEMCRKVAEATRTDRQTGRQEESHNKWRAIYILGQVYHSLGQAADAIREYTRVAEQFADAKQAIEYFARKEISLPEITAVKPGEAAEVELKFRNVARCDTRVYRIDLMKFSLLKRSLGGITQINLAGIRPYHEAAVELGDGADYRDRTRKLALPLKEEGAYLVVCRGDNLHASGLVLVTPLVVEVQEVAASGEVRTTVKDTLRDGYAPDVHVKVIGSRNSEFIAGETDLRGVFVAQAIQGTATVIAQADHNRYAFFRGQLDLGPPPPPPANSEPAAADPAPQADDGIAEQEQDLLQGLQEGNGRLQRVQEENLKNLYQQNKQGVQVKEAY